MAPTEWWPEKVLNSDRLNVSYAILVLNRNIRIKPNTFLKLWNNAAVRVLVDGGVNRWLNYVSNNYLNEQITPPDYLTGDLDSCTAAAKKAVSKLGCKICPTTDQSETDFTKALMTLAPIFHEKNICNVLTVMDYSGRIDHILAQINTLYKASNFLVGVNVYLLTKNSLSWLLQPGQHHIQIPHRFVHDQRWCSLIPVGNPCRVSTTGLKWDMDDTICEFGAMVSSSNTYADKNVRIKCDRCLLWSMGTDSDPSNGTDYD